MDDETQALLTSLNGQREHVLGALDGLSQDELRRALLPSGWSPLGMVQHLALDVERFWFRGAVAGEPLTLTSGDEAWRVPAEVPGAAIFGLYRDEIAEANAIIAAVTRTVAPLAASRRATDRPIPEPAPVTTAARPPTSYVAIFQVPSSFAHVRRRPDHHRRYVRPGKLSVTACAHSSVASCSPSRRRRASLRL
jgi:hypothetical protein